MAKISHREKILLGYNLNSLSNSPSSRRNSEVDFSDVFGGPPRCSSSQDFHNNEIDSIEDDVDDNGEGDGYWYGLREKPVFGNQIGVRKRYASDDFYDDIFGGDQPLLSSSLSPRHHISPAPVAEPSSSRSKFSLPGRTANMEIMTSTSMNQNLKFLGRSPSRFNHTIRSHSTLNSDDACTSYLPTALSRQISVDEAEFISDSKADGTTEQYEPEFILKDYSESSKFANDNNMLFHFSMYKWANKGVPIVMSSRKRSPSIRSKERRESGTDLVMAIDNGDVNVNEALLSSKPRMPSAAQARECERNNGDIAVGGTSVECKLDDKVQTNPANNEVGVKELVAHSEKGLDVKSVKHSSKMKKSNMQPLYTLFGQEKEGNKKATGEKVLKQSKVNETEKPCLRNDVFPSHKVSRKSKVRESSSRGTDDFRNGQVSGKVKDFIKIFNQDSSSQIKSDVKGQSHSSKWMDTTKFEALAEADTFPTKNRDKMQDSYVDFGNTWSEFIEVVDGESFLSREQESNINEPNIEVEGIKGSASKTIAPSVGDNLGKEVMQNMYSQLAIESEEETQSYERKVREWSKGKEGNIRALLSTMQNVLWPNNGWKPIPLVDIIEANAVKKAYQRALLCLHPDKLQQKGAAPHHKFIAEKVFDILQEAWDQFNSIGML